MLNSSLFGPFDPLNPAPAPGMITFMLSAEPVIIEAPIALVWQVMTDFKRYPEWNPFNRFFKLDTTATPGETVTFGPVWGPYDLSAEGELLDHGFVQRETITVWEPEQCLAYAATSAVFNAERAQCLSVTAQGDTCYQTYERMNGIFSPLTRMIFGAKILTGFEANGLALKKRAEHFAQYGGSV